MSLQRLNTLPWGHNNNLKVNTILKDFFYLFRENTEVLLEREAEQKHNASMTYYFKPSSVSKYHPKEQKQTLTTDALVMFIRSKRTSVFSLKR
jgi:hypothetical protein